MIDYDNPCDMAITTNGYNDFTYDKLMALKTRLTPAKKTSKIVVVSTPMAKSLHGVNVIASDFIPPPVLMYPTGYKDGNKLGKRKRGLITIVNYVGNVLQIK